MFNQSMKVLERLMAHEKKMNEFMSIKCNDRTEFKLGECERLERGFADLLSLSSCASLRPSFSFSFSFGVAENAEAGVTVHSQS